MKDNHFSAKSGSSTKEHPEEPFDIESDIKNVRDRIKKLAPCYEIMRNMKWAAINHDDRDWQNNANRGYEEAGSIDQHNLALAFKAAEMTTDLDLEEKKKVFGILMDEYSNALR